VLKPGQEPFMPTPGTPDTMYPPFVAEHLKGISAGTGLDFTTMVRWYADANYAGLRQGRLDMLAEVDWIQDLLFIQRILAADLQDWLEICIAEGRIAATGYYEDPTGAWKAAYLSTNWQGPPRASNDEIKDEAAWDMRIKGGRASLQEYCNVYGKDLEQIFGDLQECRELASEHQVRDIFDRWLFGPTVNAPKTGMRPDGTSGNPLDSQPGAAVPQGGDAGGLAGTELAELIVRQHLLQSQLEEAGHPGGNGRRM
jgi:capsid protein